MYICILANLCEVIDLYISSTATMNSPVAVNAKKNALTLSVDETVLIQRCWDMIWSFIRLKYKTA